METVTLEFIRNAIIAWFAFMLADAVWAAHKKDKKEYLFLLKSVYLSGAKEYLRSFGIFFVTILIAVEAVDYAPNFLQFGWLNLLGETGVNPTLAPLDDARTNVSPEAGPSILLASSYLLLFALSIPLISQKEEKWFRHGHIRWLPIGIKSLMFGLMHLIVGIPIIMGLVLTVPGFLYAHRYREVYLKILKETRDSVQAEKAALTASTVTHSLFNMIAVSILVTSVAINALRTS